MDQNPNTFNNNINSTTNQGAVDDLLSAYHEQYRAKNNPNHTSKSEAWQSIAQHIQSTSISPSIRTAKRYTLSTSYRSLFKYAAVFVLVALGGWFGSTTDIFNPKESMVAYSEDQITEVELADGSLVRLRPNSKLYHVPSSDGSSHYRLDGEAYFNVAKQHNGTFKVDAELAQVEVLGTAFNLSSYAQKTQVYLEEGSIALHPLGRSTQNFTETIRVEPKESVSISRTEVEQNKSVSADSYVDWLDYTIVVDNKDFEELIEELEYHYNITLNYPSNLSTEKLRGRLQLVDLTTTLSDFSLLFDGNFIEKSASSYMFVPYD